MNNVTRLNQCGQRYTVCECGSEYINYLHDKLRKACALAENVKALNPKCLSVGAGMMAVLQDLAKQITRDE